MNDESGSIVICSYNWTIYFFEKWSQNFKQDIISITLGICLFTIYDVGYIAKFHLI